MSTIDQMSFEEALQALEKNSQNLKNDSLTLEDAVKTYEEGVSYYKRCNEILNKAKQKIETVSRQED